MFPPRSVLPTNGLIWYFSISFIEKAADKLNSNTSPPCCRWQFKLLEGQHDYWAAWHWHSGPMNPLPSYSAYFSAEWPWAYNLLYYKQNDSDFNLKHFKICSWKALYESQLLLLATLGPAPGLPCFCIYCSLSSSLLLSSCLCLPQTPSYNQPLWDHTQIRSLQQPEITTSV